MTRPTIFVLYNAKASLLGKFEYACRKISSSAESSPCYACDLTHGGLRLDETTQWKKTKRRIDADIQQLHQDELNDELKDFIEANRIRFPAVLGQAPGSRLKLILDEQALRSVAKDHEAFLSHLVDSANKVKDDLFRPFVLLVPSVITPAHLTTAGFIFGVFACAAAAVPSQTYLAVYFWAANRFFDCLDGVTARQRNVASESGGFYDLTSDFVIYSAIPIAIAYGRTVIDGQVSEIVTLWMAVAVVEATFHINNFMLFYFAAIAAQKQDKELTSVTMKPALVEGFESGLLFSAMMIWPSCIQYICWVMAGGVTVGIVQRFWCITNALSISEAIDAKVKIR